MDERTTDRTAKLARKNGADVVVPVQVSDWHECPTHGRVLAQHFANARQQSFSHLDSNLTWWGWIDADDTLKGADKLADILAALPDNIIGTWNPYHYSTMKEGAVTNTLFHRERILRASVGWKWEYRVHEVATPARQGEWLKCDDVTWFHQEGVHKTDNSANRNLLLLEIDYEEDPRCSRTLFYLGNQYFALGLWEKAIYWYEQLARLRMTDKNAVNMYELWQARCYQSMAYERVGNLDAALQCAMAALDAVPEHPEPYFRLATVYALAGEPEKTIFWTEMGRRMKEPPFFVFKNPLDYVYNHRMPLSDALAQQGRVSEARHELEVAYQALPDETVGKAIEHYRGIEQATMEGQRFKEFAGYLKTNGHDSETADRLILDRYQHLPEQVKGIQSVRDVAVPLMLTDTGSQPKIIFWAVAGWEEWAPPVLNEKGIGGSETAVIEIARRFAADGWRVDVYNNPGVYEGRYDGVGYWDQRRANNLQADVFVSWRIPQLQTTARNRVLWCHDLNYGPQVVEFMPLWDRVLGVSEWHAGMLESYYDLRSEQVGYVPNGIDLSRFVDAEDRAKKAWQAVFASSPDRGLIQLLHMWRQIAKDEPGAKLVVAYGFETIDKMIAQGRQDLAQFKDACMRMMNETPGVEFVGRIPQDQLARLHSESVAWLYPTAFLEVSCITAMEAMAGGNVPVATAAGALPETIGGGGVVIPGQPHSFPWQNLYVQTARGVLADATIHRPLAVAARRRAQSLTWDASYQDHWKPMIEGLLSEQREAVAM